MQVLYFCFLTAVFWNLSNCAIIPRVDDEDAQLTVPELIEKYEYPIEVHHVTTPDGYILELHRIPYGKQSGPAENKPVVFVQHGILSSSADWVIAGPEKGIAYLLADRGYDVWMGNARGNTYSKKHIKYAPSEGEFWDFSWHEIGIYDLPTMIDYALEKSHETKLFYIGHSQGTTSFFVMCSMKPEYNAKIRAQFSLAPIAYMSHMTSPLLQIIAQFNGPINLLLKLLGIHEFLPSTELMATAGKLLCSENSMTQWVCTNTLFVLCGFNLKEMNTELLPIIMGHTPAGASTKQMVHYAQEIQSAELKLWGLSLPSLANYLHYNAWYPPQYDIGKITAPVALFYSHNDWLSAEVDVLKLYSELPNPIGRFLVTDKQFNHLDYMWGKDVDVLVYNRVFSLMENY